MHMYCTSYSILPGYLLVCLPTSTEMAMMSAYAVAVFIKHMSRKHKCKHCDFIDGHQIANIMASAVITVKADMKNFQTAVTVM